MTATADGWFWWTTPNGHRSGPNATAANVTPPSEPGPPHLASEVYRSVR